SVRLALLPKTTPTARTARLLASPMLARPAKVFTALIRPNIHAAISSSQTMPMMATGVEVPVATALLAVPATEPMRIALSPVSILFLLWLAGMAIVLGVAGVNGRRLGRLIRRASPSTDPILTELVFATAASMGVRAPRVLTSDAVDGVCVAGLL